MRLRIALLYSFIFSLYVGCFYFAFGLLHALATKGDVTSFLGDFIVTMAACFGVLTAVFYEIGGLMEEANRPRSDDRTNEERSQKDESNKQE